MEVLMDSGVRPVYRKVTKLIRLWHFSSKSFHLLQVTLTFRMNCFDLLGFHLFFDTINAQNLFHDHGYFTLAGKKKVPTIALTYTKN